MHSFRRKLWTNTYLSLESYLPTSKRCAGVGNLAKWRSEICSRCRSAPKLFKESPSFGMTELLADDPDWHLWSWTVVCFSFFSVVGEWIGSDTLELHGFNSCGWGAVEDATGSAKTFPDKPCVFQKLGGPSLRLGIPIEQELDEVGKTQVDW